ncbi:MAG TPA: hypothetical protein VG934_01075 [Candidatus Paceibacterota bacterium]|nr:hypothetical protein [Candidatus Paceibacterota bacterium]
MDKVSVPGVPHGPDGLFMGSDPDDGRKARILFQYGADDCIEVSVPYGSINGIVSPMRRRI